MSVKVYSQPGKVYPQPDFEARRETDNAGWSATQTFRIRSGTLSQVAATGYFANNRQATLLDPSLDSYWSFLRLRSVDFRNEVGGWQDIVVRYGGIPSVDPNGNPVDDPSEFQVTYSMRGVTGDVALQDHPKWQALEGVEKNALGKIANGEYGYGPDPFSDDPEFATYKVGSEVNVYFDNDPITSNNAKHFAMILAEGKTTYKGSGFTWTKRWNSLERITNAQLNLLGKIVNAPPGPPPQPAGDRNWLLAYANIEQQGELGSTPTYVNELVFEMSEPGGWDQFLQG